MRVEKLKCPCCGRASLDPKLLPLLLKLERTLGHELMINSAYRCEEHNKKVGGVPGSYHCKGMAVDLACLNAEIQEEIVEVAITCGFRGIGWGSNFIHLDLGPEREWRYVDGKPVSMKESH